MNQSIKKTLCEYILPVSIVLTTSCSSINKNQNINQNQLKLESKKKESIDDIIQHIADNYNIDKNYIKDNLIQISNDKLDESIDYLSDLIKFLEYHDKTLPKYKVYHKGELLMETKERDLSKEKKNLEYLKKAKNELNKLFILKYRDDVYLFIKDNKKIDSLLLDNKIIANSLYEISKDQYQ